MTSEYNLDSIFGDMASATEMTSELTFIKKGDTLILAMCPPLEYKGKPVLTVAVESEYQGKKGKQFIVRFIKLVKNGKEIDWENSTVTGIPLPSTIVSALAKLYETEYPLAVQECSLLMVTKNPKTEMVPSPKTVKIPDAIWESTKTLSWEKLVEAYDTVQGKKDETNTAEEKDDSTPW